MRCPSCGFEDSKVVDSRPSDEYNSIRRRRECLDCGARFTTYERLGDNPLVVLKSDGSSEVFDPDKLYRSISLACAKRPNVSNEMKNKLVADVESELRAKGRNEITSQDLGEVVLQRLLTIDDVAYIRFASVYRDFKSIEEFEEALKGLEK